MTRGLCLLAGVLMAACGSGPDAPRAPSPAGAAHTRPDVNLFVDRAREAGLDFTHVNGMSGRRDLTEIMAPGVAVFDFDNDGDLDVYAVQGPLPAPPGAGASDAGPGGGRGALTDRLYRNDLRVHADGSRELRFTDVTQAARIQVSSYGMGVATGDIDNDGWTDLYLTRVGPDVLLKNEGDGTFTDVTTRAGVADPGWTVPASFFDFDRDGWLDLFVGGYLRYSLGTATGCFGPTGAPDYCHPQNYPALPGRLYRNQRDGTFADVTVRSGVAREYGPALGSITADLNGDGWPDLYVANDGSANQLWVNRRNGTFENVAAIAGVAVNGDGRAEGSMGVDAGDYDNDGDDDVVITNLTGEGTTLYANDGTGVFRDVAAQTGLRGASLPYTGFGAAFLDVDNDGWLDVLTVNGAIQSLAPLVAAGDPFPLHQRKQVFRNRGGGRFEDVTAAAGRAFELSEVGRGAAFGDVDNDGDVDVVAANNNGPLRLLLNQHGQGRRWLGVRAVGAGGRDMLGARVGVVLADGTVLWRRVRSDGSYASANDPRVTIGLGNRPDAARIRIQWPDGRTEEWPVPGVNRLITLTQGSGR